MTEANQSPLYRLVSEKVGKGAIEYLRERRERGMSWRGISIGLLADHELDVTEVTLRKWWSDAQEAAQEAPAGTQ